MMFCPHERGLVTMDQTLRNCQSKQILPPLGCFCRVFCHSNEEDN
jgi:hypothetical protein